MEHVIVGAGPAGVIAAETLRDADSSASITLIGNEPEPPYSRMAIPYLLAGQIGEEGTYLRHDPKHYDKLDVNYRHGVVERVSPDSQTLSLAGGDSLAYDRLLIATGARPTKPPIPGFDLPGVEPCWTLEDARKIAERAKKGSHVVLIGAGFIGCIVLEALAARKVRLTVVELADRMVARMMSPIGGELLKRWCELKGVTVLTSTKTTAIEARDGKQGGLRVVLGDGGDLDADLVVCATGVLPNMDSLEGTGVATDQGILVNEYLETSLGGIYAAGDVAQGPDFSTGEKVVHAIQPTAAEHGRIAGLNMAGRKTRYRGSLSMNVLNTLGLVSSSFGLWMGVDGGEGAEALDEENFKYLRLEFDDDVVVGALSLGLTQHVGVIRGLVQTRARLGGWKAELMADPHKVNYAYLAANLG